MIVKMNRKGFSLLETIFALTILGIVLLPLTLHLPGVLRKMNDIYVKNRLLFISETIGEHFSRWAHNNINDLDAFWVENWASTALWNDFEAGKLNDLIGVNIHIPRRYRVNISTFNQSKEDQIGFIFTIYYDSDASKDLSDEDRHRLTYYSLVSERG